MSVLQSTATRTDPMGIAQDSLSSLLPEEAPLKLDPGIALCLSGGGYRAMLFHVGAILRLNELGILSQLVRVASVSGGSITAAVLGMNWKSLEWKGNTADRGSLETNLVTPVRAMAATSIDVESVIEGALLPWITISDRVAAAYDRVLFHGKTLQDLPDDHEGPRFVLTSTNVKTGSLWRFARPYMADYRIGIIDRPTVTLAHAVAASSAFPPFLSPMHLPLKGLTFRPHVPVNDTDPTVQTLRTEAILTDGGVYDNLGLEAVWKRYETVLVSDGGRKMDDDVSPAGDWVRHSRRLIDLLQHQVSSLRRRMVMDGFNDAAEPHRGAYWGIQTNIAAYKTPGALNCPYEATQRIAHMATRLSALSDRDQEMIINWGYAVCDAAIRRYVPGFQDVTPPTSFPYPTVAVGA